MVEVIGTRSADVSNEEIQRQKKEQHQKENWRKGKTGREYRIAEGECALCGEKGWCLIFDDNETYGKKEWCSIIDNEYYDKEEVCFDCMDKAIKEILIKKEER